MKDKNKEIIAIANLIYDKRTFDMDHKETEDIAKILYKQGYRKIDKDSVVLTSEQYSNYLITQTNNAWLKEQAEKLQADNERLYKNLGKFKQSVSKETAEKILRKIKERVKTRYTLLGSHTCYGDIEFEIDNIANEIGVEINKIGELKL